MKQKIALLLGLALAFTGCNEQPSSAIAPEASTKMVSGNFVDTISLDRPGDTPNIAGRATNNPYGPGYYHWEGKRRLTVQWRGNIPKNMQSVWTEVSRKWQALQDPTNPTNEFLLDVVAPSFSEPDIIIEFKDDPSAQFRLVWGSGNQVWTENGALFTRHMVINWNSKGLRTNWDDPNTLRPYLMVTLGYLLGFDAFDDPTSVMYSKLDWENGVPKQRDFFNEEDVKSFNVAYNGGRESNWIPLFKYPSRTGYAYEVAVGWEQAKAAQASTSNRLIPAGVVLKPNSKASYAPMYQSGLGIWHLPVKPGTGVPVVCEDKSGTAVGIGPATFGLIPLPVSQNWTIQSFAFAPENLYGTYARREVTGYPQSMWEVQDYLPQGTFCRRIFGAYLALKATAISAQ